ncbi:ABC transporter B family member 29, chloroplastic [Coffea eugenioides]|uniref:ABC transporter B family member 29, chloroplastic n=1 Tax=Coffea eugenioides TaxID=49369 RepID=UPI000F60FFA8|nr:ABC transporter B family member 29, chloroplastic [Coffea eugenioides]
MALLFQLTPPVYYSYSPSLHHLQLSRHRCIIPSCLKSSTPGANLNSTPHTLARLYPLKPYLQAQWQPVLYGWLCSAISVYSLSQIVPKAGRLSAVLTTLDAVTLRDQGLILGVLVLVRIISSYLQQAFLWDAALNCVYNIRVSVYRRVLERDLGFFEGKNGVSAGDIAYRITAESADVADTIYSFLNTIVPSTLQLLTMGTQMLVISPVLSLISALVIPVMALMVGCLGENLREISNRAHLSVASLSAYLNEVLPSILFVKANNAELCENIRFQLLASTDCSACLDKKKMKALIPHIIQIFYFGLLFTICAGSVVASRGSFDCSAIVSFITSLYLLIEPIQGVGKAYNELKQGEPAVERLFTLTRFIPQVIEQPDSVELDQVHGEVKFSGVSFRYEDSTQFVLNGVDLRIKAGEIVALVGPSGGGKTTVAKLLLRLYDPVCGVILMDGHDIRNIRLENLRRHVGLVSQDVTLFSGTIAENIGYRDLMADIDMERVEFAARIANADEFIETLPDRYQTNIGPRGSSLSGGQKQRLAIARVLYQNPSILILDEATSALDSRSELQVRRALERLMQNRTVLMYVYECLQVLVIAHRLETVLMAQRILLLDDGKLQELSRSSLIDAQHTSLASLALVI